MVGGFMRTKITLSGCVVYQDEPLALKKKWHSDDSIYELSHRCGNNYCINKNHLVFKYLCLDSKYNIEEYDNSQEGRSRPLTMEDAERIRELVKTMRNVDVAKLYGISTSSVYNIKSGVSYRSAERKPVAKYRTPSTIYFVENIERIWGEYLEIRSLREIARIYKVHPHFVRREFGGRLNGHNLEKNRHNGTFASRNKNYYDNTEGG